MSGRYRTVALQAVGVAVVAGVIFIAFLRPSEPGELSGIDAPGGGDEPTAVNPPDDDKAKKNGKRQGEDQNRPGGGDPPNARRANGNGPSGAADSPLDDTLAPSDGDSGPDDDQYTDLVSALMEEVGEPDLFKEIDEP